eukprot:jgi/Tetstr1/460138/TSEL_005454.t1
MPSLSVPPWIRRSTTEETKYGLRANAWQVSVVCILTVLIGGVLQVTKLMVVDSAGREFGLSSYSAKLAYLLPFGLSKALANLVVGYASDKAGRKTMECVGWGVGLLVPICLAAASKSKSPPPTPPHNTRARAHTHTHTPQTPKRTNTGFILGHALASATGSDPGSAWALVVIATIFLGGHQGLAWSCTIFITVDLLGPASKGLAVGLNETVGYTAVALFASVYKWLEGNVTCSWSAATLSNGVEPTVSAQCLRASHGECASPDDWTTECVEWCSCHGYVQTAVYATAGLMGAGLLLSLLLLRETKDSHLKKEAQQESCVSVDGDTPQLSEEYMEGLRSMVGQARAKDAHSARGHLSRKPSARTGAVKSAGPGGAEEADTATLLQHQQAMEVQLSPVQGDAAAPEAKEGREGEAGGERHCPEDSAGPSDLAPLSKDASLDLRGIPLEEVPDLPRYRRTDETVIAYSTLGGLSSSRFSLTGALPPPHPRASSMRSRPMLVMCAAGFVINMTTGLAWGLLLAWARDGLGMDGAQRNLASASYEALKGVSQLLAGLLSDKIGRKWPIATMDLQFGHLVIAACLMGIGSGISYPVMIAAVADHSGVAKRARNIGIFRFWRDLGYAGGAVSGLVSDASSPEATICVNAVLVTLTGIAVSTIYAERPASAHRHL